MARALNEEKAREELISYLRALAQELGKSPTRTDIDGSYLWMADKFFGSLNEAKNAAGLEVYQKPQSRITAQEIRDYLDGNPSTPQEIIEGLSLPPDYNPHFIYDLARGGRLGISRMSKRCNYVFYIRGQEGLAQRKLDQI